MNNVYIYDSSQIHVYETEDLGSITDVATTVVDHGVKMFDYIVQDGTPGVIHDTLIVPVGQDYIVNEVTGSIDYEDVWITETTYPVSGNINFSGGEENSAAVVFVAIAEPIVLRERAIVVTKQAWTGSGSLFEIGSGLERMVAPYIGGSGTLRISGAADSSETNSYNLDSIITYGSDADYGLVVAAVGSSHDYGQVTGIVTEGETDNGTVVDLGGSNPFGLFTFAGRSDTPNITKGYSGSGSLRLRGSVDEALDEPFNQIYIVGRNIATGQFVRRDVIGLRFHGGNPEAFARVGYQGSGSLFGFSGGEEAKVYDYTTESAVTLSTPQDYGDILTSAINNENYGQVAGIVTEGEFDNGSIVIGGYTKATEGSFSFSGISQSVRNRHHIGSGSISIAKHIDSYGEGQSSDIAFLPHYRSRGGITIANHVIPDAFARIHIGSGSLFEIGQKDERATFTYGLATEVNAPEIYFDYNDNNNTVLNLDTGNTDITISTSGNGSGQSGGFNSSSQSYWHFVGQGSSNTSGQDPRKLVFRPLDLTHYTEFEISLIAGTSSNGGENCDADEDLLISYSVDNGSTYTLFETFDAEDSELTGSTFGLKTVNIPEEAQRSGVVLKIHQEKHSGSNYDQWGVEYIKFLGSTSTTGGQVYETIDPVNHGSVDQSSGTNEDYGTVTEPFTNGIQDYGQLRPEFFKFGNLNITGGDSAHANPRAHHGDGVLNISGAATVLFDEPSTQVYTYGLTQNQTSKGEFLKFGGGMSSIITVKGTYYTSGTLFSSGGGIESTVFDYNESSIVELGTPVDNGQITSSGSTTDYGQVTEYGLGETDFGQVAILQTIQPFGKLYELSGGDIAHSNPVAYLGSTARISITGGYSNLKFVSQAGESTALFEIRNAPGGEGNTYANVKPFIGSGSLFHIGDRLESKTYSYTTASIAPTDQQYDNGSVTSASTTNEDYGLITNLFDSGLAEDYGDVSNIIGDENPFGLYRIYGSADEQYFPTFNWNRQSPPIRIFNDQQDPADFRFRPHWRTDTTTTNPPRISNGPGGEFHTYAQVRPFIGNGRLFGLGDKFESATFRYTTESIVVVENPEDYGLITSTPTQNLEYGTISSAITPGGEFDNGQVGITQTTESLTGLYKFSGESKDQFLRGPYVVKDGLIKIYKGKSAPNDFRFMPHWRSRPYEQGKLTGIAETPRARDFVGAGRLFGLGDKFESATFRYTTESIVVVEQPEDYGLITSNATQNLDFGDVSSAITPDGEVDFGQVVITQTTQSATGLYKFSGESKDQFFRGPYVAKKGFIRFYKGQSADTDFRFMPHWRGVPDEQFKVSGSAETPRGRDFVGTGSLFNIGDKIEKKVYNYTTESIEVVQPSDDWGSITTSGGTLDYGDVGSAVTPGGEFDFGQVVITQTTQSATGLFRFSGEGAEVKSSTPPAERFEISISGSAIEKVTSGDDENTILFNFTGSLAESFSKGLYNGSGSLFEIGQKDERVVFHYNTSSIGDSFGSDDRGSITTTPTTNVDNGLIADETVPPTIDYGFNIDVPGSERPLGQLFEITGADSGHKQTFSEFSSGSLFGASGAAEAAVWQTPEETFLLKMRGGAVEKHVENWVGSGLIKYPEDTPLAPNAAVRFRPHWRGAPDHSPKILGTADAAFKGAYVSKGVFSRMYTHDKGEEWLRYRPSPRYVNSIYGKIGGSAFVNGDGETRKISVFGYYGDDRDPGTSGSLFGIGGAAESRGITPPLEDTVIFTLNGTAASKFNPHWRGVPDGSPRLYGTPELQLLFNIFTNPEGERINVYGDAVPVRTINYDGSGTLFTAGSSAEVVGFNPDIETRAFKFSGEPIVRIRVILFGGGSMFGFGSGAESTTIAVPESTVLFVPSGAAVPVITLNYDGSGTEVISGTATEKRTASHVGDGSLFGTGGAAEAVAVSEAESTALFIPSGGDQNSFTRIKQGSGSATINGNAVPVVTLNFNGSGSLFSLGGSSEITTVSEESTGLFEFNGTAEPVIRTRGFAGSGSLFAVGNGAEVASVSEESTGLFTISGDAEAPFVRTKVGSGTTFISGVKEESFSKGNYDGEGSFSAFGGAAEIVGFDPAEETFLYEFTGNATATRTRGFAGSGTATVLNETVIPVITLNYFGDGSLTTFGGAAESRTVDVENTTLFEFRNGATESFSKGNYDAEGSATVSGEASDIKLTFGNEVFAYVSASGNADESKTDDYVGSGSLFSVVSTTIARTIDYDETSVGAQGEVVSTSLFRISGENPGSVTRITQPTTAEFRTQGESISKVILFSPPRTYSTII